MNKLNFFVAALALALTTSCQQETDSANEQEPVTALETMDLVIENARIYTSNKQQPWAEALVVKNGKFIYVGDSSGITSYQSARTIDLKWQLLIPGMVDGHSHPGYVYVDNFGEVEGDTVEELLASVKQYADAHPDQKWLNPFPVSKKLSWARAWIPIKKSYMKTMFLFFGSLLDIGDRSFGN